MVAVVAHLLEQPLNLPHLEPQVKVLLEASQVQVVVTHMEPLVVAQVLLVVTLLQQINRALVAVLAVVLAARLYPLESLARLTTQADRPISEVAAAAELALLSPVLAAAELAVVLAAQVLALIAVAVAVAALAVLEALAAVRLIPAEIMVAALAVVQVAVAALGATTQTQETKHRPSVALVVAADASSPALEELEAKSDRGTYRRAQMAGLQIMQAHPSQMVALLAVAVAVAGVHQVALLDRQAAVAAKLLH